MGKRGPSPRCGGAREAGPRLRALSVVVERGWGGGLGGKREKGRGGGKWGRHGGPDGGGRARQGAVGRRVGGRFVARSAVDGVGEFCRQAVAVCGKRGEQQ